MMKIAIVGGGASGLMAAARSSLLSNELDVENEIFLIERNKILGKKVIISGGGRCNFTTGIDDLKEVLKSYPRGAKFLRSAMYSFPPAKMREWIVDKGVPVKVEKDMRVFPKSDNGMHVVRAFEKVLENNGVQILFDTAVKEIVKNENNGEGENCFILKFENGDVLGVDRIVLCVGGQAYRKSGSQGDGYNFAESLGHSITELRPSLNAFVIKERWAKDVAGLSFEKVTLSFRGDEKFSFTGAMMFTHKGVTGPAVFAISACVAYEDFSVDNEQAQFFVDFFPEKNHEVLTGELKNQLADNSKKAFQNVLGGFVPKSFAKVLCDELDINPDKISNELSKKDLNRTIEFLKNMPFTIVGRVAGDEFVTAGGVALNEVDAKTMESKLCPGLFFAGEILDYDGFTGGYNLQAAWATGHLAGESIVT